MTISATIAPRPATRSDDPAQAALDGIARRHRRCLMAILALYVVLVSAMGSGRPYLGYHETDYLLFFVPDATRLLAGQPLHSPFHPPLYPMVIAASYALLGDWLAAALVVSFVSGLAALVASYLLCLRLGGHPAAFGAVLTLLGSGVFIEEAARASGDALFLALFMGSCLLAIEAWTARSRLLWWACGVTIGLELVTRSSAPPLLLLATLALVSSTPLRARLADCGCLLAGAAVPVVALLAYGAATGSTVFPTNNHLSLATSFFHVGDDHSSLDTALQAAARFGNMTEVLVYDPAGLAATYLDRIYELLAINLARLVEPPLYFMLLPGAFFLLGRRWNCAFLVIILVLSAEVLLVNLKPFHARYYLFLVPFLGAAIGHACREILRADWPASVRTTFAALLVLMFVVATGLATAKPYRFARNQMAELAELVPLARRQINPGSAVVARKPHLAFHSGAEAVFLPDFETVDRLREFLRLTAAERPAYLLYGQAERRWRPQYRALETADRVPDWLEVVAHSDAPGRWVLYRYRKP